MAAEHLYGSRANRQQGTQEPPMAKRQPASAYSRSGQRAAPSGNTAGLKSDYRAETDARDKRYGHGKFSKQKLFP